ncbi:hypothetical protein CKO51_31345 [Rhodopirellula sp. SM50]|nr:hypothetical protein CKO51_31345 [Rhodopirellula sp. SM50]
MVEHSANSEIHLIGKATAGQIIFDASIVGFSAMMYPVECNVVLKEADRNDKSFSPAYLGRARGQLRRNEIQKALDDLAEAIRVDPEFAPAYAIRSQIFSKENDARFRNGKRAVDDATTACELTKWENWEYLVPLAAAYAENGEFQLAIQWVNKTIKSAPASEREQLQEELEQYRQNKPSRFEIDPTDDVLDPNSSDSPLDASGWFDRGKAKFDAQKYRECIADFTEALNLDPTIPSAYVHRGTARRMIDEAEKAIADYGEAIRIDPTYAAAFIGRAHVLRTKGDYANAIEDYAETIRLQPDNASAFRYRAVALQEIGEADQAIEDWSQAILLHPKNSWSYRRRGFLWHARGDYQQAINDFEVAIDLDSESAWAHNQLAWLLASCPDHKYRDGSRAIELATKACTLSEWKDTHIDTLAAAYAESGDFDEAIRWQEKAIELAPAASKDDYRSRLKLYKSGEPYYAE